VNNGTITYDLSEPGTPSKIGSAEDPFENYSTEANKRRSVMTTKSSGDSSSSTTESLYNNTGKTITMNGSSYTSVMSVETLRGYAINNGMITLNQNQFGTEGNGIGMYAYQGAISASYIQNLGLIDTNFYMSAAMASESTQNAAVINDGTITAKHEYSIGMYVNGKSLLTNNKDINMNASNSVAMYATEADSANMTNSKTGQINIGEQSKMLSNVYGLFSKGELSTISNFGTINIYGNNSTAIKSTGEASVIKNNNKISGVYTKGIESTGANTRIENLKENDDQYGQIIGALQYGIYATGEKTTINNTGDIGYGEDGPATGIYAAGQNSNLNNSGQIYASNTGIYAAGQNSTVSNSGQIGSESYNPVYGIYATEKDVNLNNSGQIYASNTGIYASGQNSTVSNSGQIGSENYRPAYGIRAEGTGSTIINNSPIYASDIGIYVYAGQEASNQTSVENNSVINSNSYGIYAVVESDKSKLNIVNNGTIIKNGGGSGIIYLKHLYEYPEQKPEDFEEGINVNPLGENVVRQDEYKEAQAGTSSALSLSSRRVNMVNTGLMSIESDFNFDDEEVAYTVGLNGSYKAPSLSGTVLASAAIVQNGFADVYTNTDSFIGQNAGINVVSSSYMYDADTVQNGNGNTDIVLKRKPFTELTGNVSLADFLEKNYQQENNDTLYQNLKVVTEGQAFAEALNENFELDTIPNFAKQNLDAERILNTEIASDLLQITEQENRHISKITIHNNDVDGNGGVSGYKDTIMSAYGIRDSRVNNNWRAGLGISVLRGDTKYDNHAKRYNNILEIMAPVTFQKENLSALIKPKAGFGRGHYRRPTQNEIYKADTKEYYYGADMDAKYMADFAIVTLEPNIGLSLTGMYSESMHEKNSNLKIKNKNIVSALSSVGLNIGKVFEITRNQSVSLTAGGKYYHEFGNKHTNKVFVSDMDGFYKVDSNRFNRDFGLMSLKAGYNYNGFTIQASANVPVETKHNTYYMLNLGYKF
ncbi:MAG: hypothetical protein MJ212_02640, partial [Alphaproteobacteria bacterium]|nr:hypothetical protein [Alphaproteobacteria bacterium]